MMAYPSQLVRRLSHAGKSNGHTLSNTETSLALTGQNRGCLLCRITVLEGSVRPTLTHEENSTMMGIMWSFRRRLGLHRQRVGQELGECVFDNPFGVLLF